LGMDPIGIGADVRQALLTTSSGRGAGTMTDGPRTALGMTVTNVGED